MSPLRQIAAGVCAELKGFWGLYFVMAVLWLLVMVVIQEHA